MENRPAWLSIGWLLALIALIIVIVIWASGNHVDRDWLLGLLALLALSRLIP